jgi:NAD/NADP transhydrogenase alpha subunit
VAGGLTVGTVAIAKTDTDTSNTGSVTLDFSANQNFVLTLTGNVTLANPSTETVGQSGFIVCIQDSTGGRTLSLGTDYETAAGAGITLSSAASATDIIPYVVAASDRILLGAPQLAFS